MAPVISVAIISTVPFLFDTHTTTKPKSVVICTHNGVFRLIIIKIHNIKLRKNSLTCRYFDIAFTLTGLLQRAELSFIKFSYWSVFLVWCTAMHGRKSECQTAACTCKALPSNCITYRASALHSLPLVL